MKKIVLSLIIMLMCFSTFLFCDCFNIKSPNYYSVNVSYDNTCGTVVYYKNLPTAGNSITESSVKTFSLTNILEGETVNLVASAKEGYYFVGFFDIGNNLLCATETYSFSLQENMQIVVSFAPLD